MGYGDVTWRAVERNKEIPLHKGVAEDIIGPCGV